MIEEFLKKLGASTRITIGVSVSPNIGLEMIEIDRATSSIAKYGVKPLDYDYSTREIKDYDQFRNALDELFEELRIPKTSNVVLNLPNVHFGIITLPLLLTDDAITNAIMSEVEQSYIFKRQEPVVSWTEIGSNIDTENRTLAYTAVQKPCLELIHETFAEIGATLVGVETSYASILRALDFTGIANDKMKNGVTWNLMVVGQNSYSILSMVDKKIVEYYEEPLALKSFVDDEIYNAITTSAQLTLAGLPANHLLIISETDLVSSQVLSLKIPFEGAVSFLECNKYVQKEFITASLEILPNVAIHITPEAVGSVVYPFSEFQIKLNLLSNLESKDADLPEELQGYPRVNLGSLEVELTPDFVKKISLMVGAVIIVPLFLLSILLGKIILPKSQAHLDSIKKQIEQSNATIQQYQEENKTETFNLSNAMDKIFATNRKNLLYYGSLGVSIQNKLWITYYMTNDQSKIDIKGKSASVESIYNFYKSIKQLVNNSDIRLYKLEVASGSIDDIISDASSGPKYYDFEITNMTESELNPPAQAANQSQDANAPQTQGTENKDEKKSGFQFGQPLFGQKNTQENAEQQPTQSAPPGQLPKNLEKIEKF